MNIKDRVLNPFKDLFKDCPELIDEINKTHDDFFKSTEANKETKREGKELLKEFTKRRERKARYCPSLSF